MLVGIIGGTGVYQLNEQLALHPESVATPYGEAQVARGVCGGREVVFLARHGVGHTVPPHRINYRANVDALRLLGCQCVVATNAVGAIRAHMEPGHLVLPDQFIDFTKARAATFHDGGDAEVRHVDVSEPYCGQLRGVTAGVPRDPEVVLHDRATLVCTEGPRFETPAEIRMFAALGGDLVGMTGVPEVVLAREAGLCYVSVCVVTNFAAGVKSEPLTEGEVTDLMQARLPALCDLILRLVAVIPEARSCRCRG